MVQRSGCRRCVLLGRCAHAGAQGGRNVVVVDGAGPRLGGAFRRRGGNVEVEGVGGDGVQLGELVLKVEQDSVHA